MKEKFCLDSISSFQQINAAPTNKSKTKQTFSFSKSPRFSDPRPYCQKNTYGSQPLEFKRKQSAKGIGYGNRSDFTKCLTVSPPSSKYHLKSGIQLSLANKKGTTLGQSREKIKFDSYIDRSAFSIPGSTKYKNQKSPRIIAPSYSMRQKTKIPDKRITIEPQNDNPGPGMYQNPQINYNSSNYASKFQKLSYSSSKSKRFANSGNFVPGPGRYQQVSNLSAVGKYIVSNMRGGTKSKFDKLKRIHKFDQTINQTAIVPGPGSYKQPSEFGQYDGDVYRNYQTIDATSINRSRMANIKPRK